MQAPTIQGHRHLPQGKTALGDRIMKVNHAGEHGAICIYTAQIFLARLTAPDLVEELIEFRSHERSHRAVFDAELQRRGQAKCRSYHVCGIGGYTLGLLTGLFGASAISATTVAIESVVLRHLQQQIKDLSGGDVIDTSAINAIRIIIEEEQRHHDHSARHCKPDGFWSRLLGPIVAASTETVIWLGMRL